MKVNSKEGKRGKKGASVADLKGAFAWPILK